MSLRQQLSTFVAPIFNAVMRFLLPRHAAPPRPIAAPFVAPAIAPIIEPAIAPAIEPVPPSAIAQADEPLHDAHVIALDRYLRPYESLGDLLAKIEVTFESLTVGAWKQSYVPRATRQALKRIGPHVIPECAWVPQGGSARVIAPKKWPGLIFTALPDTERNESDRSDKTVYPSFFFALKLDKLPWYVERAKGVAYECGAAWHVDGKHFWQDWCIVIDPTTGHVEACRQLQQETVAVGDGHYCRKFMGVSHLGFDVGEEEMLKRAAEIFAMYFQFWHRKTEFWSVSVRRARHRVTFCIDPTNTKSYFKDRGFTAIARDGKRKRIIHFVAEHARQLASGATTTVREHIRGIRKFDWRGFECAVTAPDFHMSLDQFDVGMHHEDDLPAGKAYGLRDVASSLASMEDDQVLTLPRRTVKIPPRTEPAAAVRPINPQPNGG